MLYLRPVDRWTRLTDRIVYDLLACHGSKLVTGHGTAAAAAAGGLIQKPSSSCWPLYYNNDNDGVDDVDNEERRCTLHTRNSSEVKCTPPWRPLPTNYTNYSCQWFISGSAKSYNSNSSCSLLLLRVRLHSTSDGEAATFFCSALNALVISNDLWPTVCRVHRHHFLRLNTDTILPASTCLVSFGLVFCCSCCVHRIWNWSASNNIKWN